MKMKRYPKPDDERYRRLHSASRASDLLVGESGGKVYESGCVPWCELSRELDATGDFLEVMDRIQGPQLTVLSSDFKVLTGWGGGFELHGHMTILKNDAVRPKARF